MGTTSNGQGPKRERVPVPTADELAELESPGDITAGPHLAELMRDDADSASFVVSEDGTVLGHVVVPEGIGYHLTVTQSLRTAAVAQAALLRRQGRLQTAREVMLGSLQAQCDLAGVPTAFEV